MILAEMLPYESPELPRQWRWARPAGYVLIALLLILPVIQFQKGTVKNYKRSQSAEAQANPDLKKHKGAIGRWRDEIHQFWLGENIYKAPVSTGVYVERSDDEAPTRHPNMPFVVMLLTPFAYMSVPAMALTYNIAKLIAIAAMLLAAISFVKHDGRRMPDWLAFLGILAGVDFLIGDIQHGNTNTFVALAVIGHLWLFRKGHDWLSGVALALGICLKLTPALFILYWIYQREWKVLLGTFVALPLMILAPALFMDWNFYTLAMGTWWNELIYPGLVKGTWYPVHVNQSLPAMVSRLLTRGDSGNIHWDSDHDPIPPPGEWINLVDIGAANAKLLLQAMQAGIVLIAAWVIGWKKLPRDDGRRAVHAGMICVMMLLMNQRTWDHHATYMVLPHIALAYAAVFANLPKPFRRNIAIAQIFSVALLLLASGDLLEFIAGSEEGANRLIAYGTAFWQFLIVWVLCVVVGMKLKSVNPPYLAARNE